MPSDEEKNNFCSSSSSSIASNGSCGSDKSHKKEKHKYCLLCNRNEFSLSPLDRCVGNDVQTIFEIDIRIKESRKICVHCLFVINLLKLSAKHEDQQKQPPQKHPPQPHNKNHRQTTATESSSSTLSSSSSCCSTMFKEIYGNGVYISEVRKKYKRYLTRLVESKKASFCNKSPSSPSSTSSSSAAPVNNMHAAVADTTAVSSTSLSASLSKLSPQMILTATMQSPTKITVKQTSEVNATKHPVKSNKSLKIDKTKKSPKINKPSVRQMNEKVADSNELSMNNDDDCVIVADDTSARDKGKDKKANETCNNKQKTNSMAKKLAKVLKDCNLDEYANAESDLSSIDPAATAAAAMANTTQTIAAATTSKIVKKSSKQSEQQKQTVQTNGVKNNVKKTTSNGEEGSSKKSESQLNSTNKISSDSELQQQHHQQQKLSPNNKIAAAIDNDVVKMASDKNAVSTDEELSEQQKLLAVPKTSNTDTRKSKQSSAHASSKVDVGSGAAARKKSPSKMPTNTRKSVVELSTSTPAVKSIAHSPSRQQKNCTFEQALLQTERKSDKKTAQKRSSSTSKKDDVVECEGDAGAAVASEKSTQQTVQSGKSKKSTKSHDTTIIPDDAKNDPKMFCARVVLSNKLFKKRVADCEPTELAPTAKRKKKEKNNAANSNSSPKRRSSQSEESTTTSCSQRKKNTVSKDCQIETVILSPIATTTAAAPTPPPPPTTTMEITATPTMTTSTTFTATVADASANSTAAAPTIAETVTTTATKAMVSSIVSSELAPSSSSYPKSILYKSPRQTTPLITKKQVRFDAVANEDDQLITRPKKKAPKEKRHLNETRKSKKTTTIISDNENVIVEDDAAAVVAADAANDMAKSGKPETDATFTEIDVNRIFVENDGLASKLNEMKPEKVDDKKDDDVTIVDDKDPLDITHETEKIDVLNSPNAMDAEKLDDSVHIVEQIDRNEQIDVVPTLLLPTHTINATELTEIDKSSKHKNNRNNKNTESVVIESSPPPPLPLPLPLSSASTECSHENGPAKTKTVSPKNGVLKAGALHRAKRQKRRKLDPDFVAEKLSPDTIMEVVEVTADRSKMKIRPKSKQQPATMEPPQIVHTESVHPSTKLSIESIRREYGARILNAYVLINRNSDIDKCLANNGSIKVTFEQLNDGTVDTATTMATPTTTSSAALAAVHAAVSEKTATTLASSAAAAAAMAYIMSETMPQPLSDEDLLNNCNANCLNLPLNEENRINCVNNVNNMVQLVVNEQQLANIEESPFNTIESPAQILTELEQNSQFPGIGFESPATVDSTTSGYSTGTTTSTIYSIDMLPPHLHASALPNGTIIAVNDFGEIHPNFVDENDGIVNYFAEGIANCVEIDSTPLEQINQDDIISVLGKPTNDPTDLNMDNIPITLDTAANADSYIDKRIEYFSDESSSNGTINCFNVNGHSIMAAAGPVRTKASLKQMDDLPMIPLNEAFTSSGISSVQILNSSELKSKLLRHDNPLLNHNSAIDDNAIEIQQVNQSFSVHQSSMPLTTATTTTTIQIEHQANLVAVTPRRLPNGALNIVFSTPSKRVNVANSELNNEDLLIDDLFINESQQHLLNSENFTTSNSTEEIDKLSQLDLYQALDY